MLWIKGALEQRCTENSIQNPWKVLVRYFTAKVTVDAAFLKINSFTSIFEEVWPQFQLPTFMNIYCSEQFPLRSSSDCDFCDFLSILCIDKISCNESNVSFLSFSIPLERPRIWSWSSEFKLSKLILQIGCCSCPLITSYRESALIQKPSAQIFKNP